MSAGAFGGFLQLGIKPYEYDIFVDEYAAMTPKETGAVDPALVHPQERVDEAVRYVVETYEGHIAPCPTS
jgi:hypothetical protein